MTQTFCNKNAMIDGSWDAMYELGNRNQYNEGSASWNAYEKAFALATVKLAEGKKSGVLGKCLPQEAK
jgi:hypothetical protein